MIEPETVNEEETNAGGGGAVVLELPAVPEEIELPELPVTPGETDEPELPVAPGVTEEFELPVAPGGVLVLVLELLVLPGVTEAGGLPVVAFPVTVTVTVVIEPAVPAHDALVKDWAITVLQKRMLIRTTKVWICPIFKRVNLAENTKTIGLVLN